MDHNVNGLLLVELLLLIVQLKHAQLHQLILLLNQDVNHTSLDAQLKVVVDVLLKALVLLQMFKLPALKILLVQSHANGIQLPMHAEISLVEIIVDQLMLLVKELAQVALQEPTDIVPLLPHVLILKSELLVFQELMDLASGLLDTLTLMELRALVSHIHHVRV
jgi:hypothetical protein